MNDEKPIHEIDPQAAIDIVNKYSVPVSPPKTDKRGIRQPRHTGEYLHRQERVKERVIALRRRGWSWKKIAAQTGRWPTVTTMYTWRKEDADFGERCDMAYDEHVRDVAEWAVDNLEHIVDAPGLTEEPLDGSRDAVEADEDALKPNERVIAKQTHSRLMVTHAKARASAFEAAARTGMEIAGRRLPSEWGKDRDQNQQVIVIEAPGGWMTEAATAGLEDENGQGPEAAAAAERWRKIRTGATDT